MVIILAGSQRFRINLTVFVLETPDPSLDLYGLELILGYLL